MGARLVLSLVWLCIYGSTAVFTKRTFVELADVYKGPVAVDFVTPSTVVVSERTALFMVDLETGVKKEVVGSATIGGYVDGERDSSRFGLINDVVVQGNYIYIADYSCVRIYDMERKKVATLAGICGRMEDVELVASTASPEFKGHLKLAVSARDLYVLDGDKVSRVDRETGVVWTLSVSQMLSSGHPTSIEVDRYSNTLFVAVVRVSEINIVAIDIASGKQSLHRTIRNPLTDDSEMTAMVASLDVAPDGTIFVLEPHGIHGIDRYTHETTSQVLENYGYHEIAVSSRYLLITQEFYSRMYKLHVMDMAAESQSADHNETMYNPRSVSGIDRKNTEAISVRVFKPQTFYLAIVFPSVLFLLVIIVVIVATRRITRNRANKRLQRPTSDASSEKYFLNQEGNQYDENYWM